MVSTVGPSTVRTLGHSTSVRYPFQRKGFYAKGYHYAFYMSNSYLCYKSSSDGENWGDEEVIRTASDGAEFSVWLDRSDEPGYVNYVYAEEDQDGPLINRRGYINGPAEGDGPGTIAWGTERIAVEFDDGYSYKNVTICVSDTGGFPFIGYTKVKRVNGDAIPYVTSSTTKDTWTPRGGFPKDLSAVNDDSWVCVVVPWEDNIFALYARDNNEIKYDYYEIDGVWAGKQDTGITMGGDATKLSVTSQRPGAVPAQDPKRVHVAFCSGDEDLEHFSVSVGDIIAGPTLIYASTSAMGPAISTRLYGGDVNHYRTLYVFWTPTHDYPETDYVCYMKSVDAGANWTDKSGGVLPEEWIDETGPGLSGVNIASSYFEEGHHTNLPEGYIGLLYTNEGASPDYVRWAGIEFADPDEELLGEAIIRHSDIAELLGKFEAQATAELLGKGIIRNSDTSELLGKEIIRHSDTAELLGKFDVGQGSAELLGKFDVQAIAELLGKFDVGQNSAELLGKFDVGQNSAELLGKFDVGQNSAELLGKFEAQTTAELLGKFEAQATAEFLGKFDVGQGSADFLGKAIIKGVGASVLLGKAIIRQPGSAEFLGRFEAQATAELLGKFDVGQGSAELLGNAEIRQSGSAELLGKFDVGQGSAELLGKFEAQATAELLGKFETQATAELLGKFEVQATAELLGKFDVGQDSAELLGKFDVGQGSAELLGTFDVGQDSAELLGKVEIQQSDFAELLGRFEAQAIAELLGKFDVGQGSAELLGRFDVGQATAELLGRFEAQAIAELLGKFEVQATAELLGKFDVGQDSAELLGRFEVQAIAELLGRFEVQAIAELLGKFDVGQDSAELLGKFDVGQDSAELLGKLRASTDHWMVQGVSVEAYIALGVI